MESQDIWVTRDGRRLAVTALDDAHLGSIVRMGIRNLAKHFHEEALASLAGAAGGDDGMQYYAEVQCDEIMARAANPRELLRYLAGTKRYGAVVREARTRSRLRRAAG